MEKEFVPYELAVKLKELGFNEHCIATYDEDKNFELQDFFQTYETFPSHIISAPTFSQAFRWFRKNYCYLSYVCAPYKEHNEFYFRIRYIGDVLIEGELESCESQVYKSYEEAELACLSKLIEIVEQKEK